MPEGGFTQNYWPLLWCSGMRAHSSANQLSRLPMTLVLHAVGREASKGRELQSSSCCQTILGSLVLDTESSALTLFRPPGCRGSVRASQADMSQNRMAYNDGPFSIMEFIFTSAASLIDSGHGATVTSCFYC